MDYPMALAVIGSVAFVAGGGASVIKTLNGKKVCNLHGLLMSDVASIKTGIMLLSSYVTRQADAEGINLNDVLIKSMMKKGGQNE